MRNFQVSAVVGPGTRRRTRQRWEGPPAGSRRAIPLEARSRGSGTDALSERPERRRRWGASHRRRFHTGGRCGHNGRVRSGGGRCSQRASHPGPGVPRRAGWPAMSTSHPTLRKLRPWLVGWLAFQAAVALAGWVTAWGENEGDESGTSIRRVFTHNGMELHPTNPQLSRLRVDLAMAGAEIDLTAIPRPAAGLDLTVRAMMAGMAVRVPSDWRVWWRFRGVGGIGSDGSGGRTHDEHDADLRIHAGVLFGGVGLGGDCRQQKPGCPRQAISAGGTSSRSTVPSMSP